jgi:hypothetical protein
MNRLGAIMLGLTLVLLGSGLAEATRNASGPVPAANGDTVSCIAANAGTGNISSMEVSLHVQGCAGASVGATNGGCNVPIEPGEGCPVYQVISGLGTCDEGGSAFCEVIFSSGKVRGSVCNFTKGLCLETR